MKIFSFVSKYICVYLICCLAPILSLAEEIPGKSVYLAKCASCHGELGEGVEDLYDQPLIGDRSVKSLTRIISETMPEGEPEECVAEEAELVAKYMHEAFYSPIAQARLKPPRIELSRLTISQYRNSVADLFGPFQLVQAPKGEHGLKAEYYNSRNYRGDKKVLDRIDAQVNFDFGGESPVPDKIDKEAHSIRWKGSLYVPESGEYEFVINTPNGVYLWVNDNKTPLIDGWVSTGQRTLKASLFLLGGRTYPIRMDTFKYKEETASIELKWKPPGKPEEFIPASNLIPEGCRETLVVEAPFPPDDQSYGYVRGTTISKEWDEATTYAAIEIVQKAMKKLRRYVKSKPEEKEYPEKCREFCARILQRAFRRPLDDELVQKYVTQHFEQSADVETAIKRVLLQTFKSPRFLFREASGEYDQFTVAERLAFVLWDSVPDQKLMKLAEEGKLTDPQVLDAEVRRMVDDPRTKTKLRHFLLSWLKVDHFESITKDPEAFPEFTEAVTTDLRTSLEMFLDELIESEQFDYRQLLLSSELYLNEPLAKYYDIKYEGDGGFQKLAVDPQTRSGVLTHPLLLAGFAHYAESSPIHRGVFVSRNVLGRRLKQPAEAPPPLPPKFHPELNTRERVILQTKAQSCSVCHEMINPLGFPLENFDAVGRFRSKEKGRPVDASGTYENLQGETFQFNGPRELAEFLANSPETHAAFTEKLFQHFVMHPLLAYGFERPQELKEKFVASQYDIKQLLFEISKTAALNQVDSTEETN